MTQTSLPLTFFFAIPKKIVRSLALWCTAALLAVLGAVSAPAQTLKDIRLSDESGQTRAILELDQPVPYRAFTLSGPPRLVVDFTGLEVPAGFRPASSSLNLVRDVRLGQFNAHVSRVVFDLNESARLATSFFLGPQGGAAYRLVLDLTPGSPAPDGVVIAESTQGSTGSAPSAETSAPIRSGAGCATCQVVLPLPRPRHLAPQRYIIVIDPGHGGRDPGAVSSAGVRESDIVLEMAKEISNELRRSGGYDVYLTRGRDRQIPLSERAELARGRAADFFLSIHANANPDPGFRGFMVFTLSDSASDSYAAEVAARENRAELGALANLEDEEVGHILGDMVLRDTLNQSIDFAARLVERLAAHQVRLATKPQRRAGFVVLKSVRMPSALLEIGHLTNPAEARALQSRRHRRKIATAVRQALDDHFANN